MKVGDIVRYIYHVPTDYVKIGVVTRHWEDDYWYVLWFDDDSESDNHVDRLELVS